MKGLGIIVGLDIGTTKICTVIGEVGANGVLDIIGEGTVPSDGLKGGVVVNLERTTNGIRASIAAAERMAGVQVTSAYINVAGLHLKALTSHGMAAIRRQHEIAREDVDRAIESARAINLDPNLEVLHELPQEYVLDAMEGIRNPVGMKGVRLEVDVHIVAGAQGPLANLRRCAADAGLHVDGLVLQSYASGLAVLEASEREQTMVVADISGATTDVGVFQRGNLARSFVLPLGGDRITDDLVSILKIPREEAERLKRKYGSALPELAESDVSLEITQSGQVATLSPFDLSRIIKPRMAEILDLIRHEVDDCLGPMELVANGVVLTGGGALLRGLPELARERFKLGVRVGVPVGLSGVADAVLSPAHATAVGLIRYGMLNRADPDGYEDATPIIEPVTAGNGAERALVVKPVLRPKPEKVTPTLWDKIRDTFKDFF